ncbi:MAG: RNA polymerase sigma factor [Actinomycetota bacterium]
MELDTLSGHERVMAETSDVPLWSRIRESDRQAFGDFFDLYADDIYNFVFRRTASWDAAEEMTSAVFLEAWRRRSELIPERDTLRPWLFGVAINLMRNRSRSARRRDAAMARIHVNAEPDFADEVAGRIDDERLMDRTLAVFELLPESDREILGLVAWEGLSYSEVSEALGVPIGTVRSRVHRSRLRLVELLGDRGHEQVVEPMGQPHRTRRDRS